MVSEGGPFYDIALANPFRALIRIYDRVYADRECEAIDRAWTCSLILTIAASFAFRINEKFRRRAKG